MQSRPIAAHSRGILISLSRRLQQLQKGFQTLGIEPFTVMDSSERYCYEPTLHWNPQVEEYFVKAYGAEHFRSISKALTRPSCYSCIRVNILKTTSDAVIEKLLAMQHGADGRSIDKDLIHKCPIPGLDYVVFVRGSGPHKIEYNYAPQQPFKEVIVSRKCAESVLRGAQVYVPGVLACSGHVEKGDRVAVSVAIEQPQPDGKWSTGITRGIVLRGSETDPQYIQRMGLYIGQGTTMLSRAGIFRALEGVAVSMSNTVFDLPSFNNVLEGEIFLQNLPSIVAAHALDPQRGERVLDMCAAPGGKTTAIAMLMRDEGEVVAADRSHNKVIDVQNLADEMGLKSIVTYKLDALKSVAKNIIDSTEDISTSKSSIVEEKLNNDISHGNGQIPIDTCNSKTKQRTKNGPGKNHFNGGRVEKSKGFAPNSFDRVLLDAPCSALGLRPRLFAGEETLESLRNHGKYQRRMFDQAVQLVRPGGVLVYSTCTINPGENEAVVRYALDTYKFLSLAPQHPKVGGSGLLGRCDLSDGYVEEWLRPGEEELVQRFDPSSSDTIGFFIAKFNVGCKDTS
ncbi:rRNA (cytosine-C(5))-methyltransferase NOP2C isoform X1 [Amaranthus tricolor]|uniref:rRNA (cytosine-C(5))-methyltransferase NOP2C isoform X1 n=2 Tax=Amaranthus tricolor TaxID=29722 RepID=UPI00258CE49D|nr:rRNA (cytosine-C(5))-methyltransferase NOP2C isoform X1 [Amaranthus tricolor]